MRIGIDIRILSAGFSGIPNYVKNILDNLQLIDDQNRYFLFEYPGCRYEVKNKNWEKYPVNPHVQSILATQFLIPFHIKKLNGIVELCRTAQHLLCFAAHGTCTVMVSCVLHLTRGTRASTMVRN